LLNDQNAHAADDAVLAATQPAPHEAAQTDTAAVSEPVAAPQDHPAPPVLAAEAAAEALPAAEPDAPPPESAAHDTMAIAPEAAPEPEAPLPLFVDTGLSEPILRAVLEKGYLHPTPIQAQAIPVVLAGRDIMGVAQTGTGKTASFVLPMMDILSGSRARARMPRSLILEPTRELALQVAENFVQYGKYLKLNHALLIGGESMNDQRDALTKGVDVLIATPGRLLDLIERGGLLLTDCRVLVIDEADRMLDMGFIPDVEKIVGFLPANRQTLFFSATMAPEIRRLADAFLSNPKTITVSRAASVATTIVMGLALVAEHDKREALRRLIRSEDVQNALIFCNRKRDVDILYKSLTRHGFSVGALHGDMAQPVRFATLEKFKANELRLLVCSDVAARGLDIGGLSHVFNFDVPIHAEDFVHRIGRTGRAGREGHAFTLASPDDRQNVEAIEKLTGGPIPRMIVAGLDVVEWAEGSGGRRGRGGRGGSKSAPKKTDAVKTDAVKAEPGAPREERAPRAASGRPKRAPRGEKRVEAPMDLAAEQPVIQPRAEPRSEPRGEPRAQQSRQPEPRYQEPRHQEPRAPEPRYEARPDRGPRRWRDDDLGPSVTGFGDDVPAFMLLPRRNTRVRPHEQDEAA
jgi:superfamily II DNA/RNA helicase